MIVFRKELTLKFGHHFVPTFDWILVLLLPFKLYTIPPSRCIAFQYGHSKLDLLVFWNILIIKMIVHGIYPIHQLFKIQTSTIDCTSTFDLELAPTNAFC